MEKPRVAFALLCALAVCCSVMYLTADGNEFVHEIIKGKNAGTSVDTVDSLKAGQIYTETPDGRMRLMDYFNNVEKEIGDEVANRKADIASVRAQMARDFAFNAAARGKLKKEMLHKMAVNAKIARDNLNMFMRKTQYHFAAQAHLANRRYRATTRRDKRTMRQVRKDKRAAAKSLKLAVSAWQKSTSAWASATNAKIDRMNKHVAANAVQIMENAKKARKDLETTMGQWDHKINKFRTESKAARDKLSLQFAAQSAATRAWANNKIKGLVASTAAQFNDVEMHMAKNRHEVDMALKRAVMRFEASLNAEKALEDSRYAQTVADIAAAKREASEKVAAATSEFKVQLLTLSSTVKAQVSKVNNRIDATAGVVRSDAAAQAKVNANVNAEMSRMVALGNKRYKHQLKDDAELQNLISKDKAETDEKLNKMALEFNSALSKVRGELARDRAHAEKKLNQGTSKLWKSLYANQEKQREKNAEMEANTRRMRLDAMDAVAQAKKDFRKKIHELSTVVAANDKKADAKIEKLTGVVKANAAKSKKGREEIAALEHANKEELKKAIGDMIKKGEQRAQLVEERGAKMDKDTKWLVNNNLNSEITKLKDETDKSVADLAALDSDARKAMKKEMLYAVRTAAEVAKNDLTITMHKAEKTMIAFEAKASKVHANSDIARKALKAKIEANAKQVSRMLKDAVDTDARAQVALKEETHDAIKKTNKRLTAYSDRMRKDAEESRGMIKALTDKTIKEIKTEEERAKAAVENFSSEDAARQASALKFLGEQMEIAKKETEQKFGAAYEKLADDREHAETKLASSLEDLNDSLAKQAALADSRFSKTVKDVNAARKQAADQVAQARKDFATGMNNVKTQIHAIQEDIAGRIGVVTGEVRTMKAQQYAVNAEVKKEMGRIEELSNSRFSESKKARGKLKMLMDENKAAAAAEVAALSADLETKLEKLDNKRQANKAEMEQDLTDATKHYYEHLAAVQKKQTAATEELNASTEAEVAAAAAALAAAKKLWDSKIIMTTNVITANAKKAKDGIAHMSGVVQDYAKASAADRKNIKDTTDAMEKELKGSLQAAIQDGEAKAKAVEQRIAEHLKGVKRFLQVELASQVESAADTVFKMVEGKRHKMADNYLSLKAYSVAAADVVDDYVTEGKGRGLSSIGDLLETIAGLGAVKPEPADGTGMGGTELVSVFSGESMVVPGKVAAINGLVNEFSEAAKQVRQRWPMGLGKYLLDRAELSMMSKGVLQVDTVEGKSGNFVFINGRSVGLSNKMSDFAGLGAKMTAYESVLAKLTSKLSVGPHTKATISAPPPEWEGN